MHWIALKLSFKDSVGASSHLLSALLCTQVVENTGRAKLIGKTARSSEPKKV